MPALSQENVLITTKHVLLHVGEHVDVEQWQELKGKFCGVVVESVEDFNTAVTSRPLDTLIYLCGDIKQVPSNTLGERRVYVVRELSLNYEEFPFTVVGIEEVPVHIKNIGVFFKQGFPKNKDYFGNITNDHTFQVLTESNKPSNAYRTGIYLTPVSQLESDPDTLKFHLLRCSANLKGPSDNFRTTDNEVVGRMNQIAQDFYSAPTDMNHVLAQVYHNSYSTADNGKVKERKAKIKDHSDKTKDMDPKGLIAFVTFYKNDEKSTDNPSAFTKLRFRRKHGAKDVVDIVLYPNSILLISLSTNRIYTHEIIPSSLSIDQIPTRLGYVVRCAAMGAIFKNGQTFLELKDTEGKTQYTPLAEADAPALRKLRELYFAENTTDDVITYPEIYFSMNLGDYTKPLL